MQKTNSSAFELTARNIEMNLKLTATEREGVTVIETYHEAKSLAVEFFDLVANVDPSYIVLTSLSEDAAYRTPWTQEAKTPVEYALMISSFYADYDDFSMLADDETADALAESICAALNDNLPLARLQEMLPFLTRNNAELRRLVEAKI